MAHPVNMLGDHTRKHEILGKTNLVHFQVLVKHVTRILLYQYQVIAYQDVLIRTQVIMILLLQTMTCRVPLVSVRPVKQLTKPVCVKHL